MFHARTRTHRQTYKRKQTRGHTYTHTHTHTYTRTQARTHAHTSEPRLGPNIAWEWMRGSQGWDNCGHTARYISKWPYNVTRGSTVSPKAITEDLYTGVTRF